jgi:TrkA domain protein
LRYDFVTRKGRRIGVVSRRDGTRDLLVFDEDDPDACRVSIRLTPEEADALAELLGAPRIVERLVRLREVTEGLVTDGVEIAPGSPYDGRTLGETRARARTGATVVAVIRDGRLIPAPDATFRFVAGDHAIVVGTPEGVRGLGRLLAEG